MKSSTENTFSQFLLDRLKQELPGYSAQSLMAPLLKNVKYKNFTPPPDTKQSAVLVLLNEVENDLEILLTLRSTKLNTHSGQISFPGGRTEPNETPEQTAIRESYEEIGLPLDKIEIIGRLSNLYVPPSKSNIIPVIAKQIETFNFILNPDEVEEVFYIKISQLLNSDNLIVEEWVLQGNNVNVPYWNIHPTTPLWGATSAILKELIVLFEEYLALK